MTKEDREKLLMQLRSESPEESIVQLRIDVAVIKDRVMNGIFMTREACHKYHASMWKKLALLVIAPLVAGLVGLLFAWAKLF